MADYTVSAKITGDASSFQKAFESARDTADKVGKSIEGAGTKLMAVTGAFVGAGIAGVNSFDNLKSATNQFLSSTGIAAKQTLTLSDGTTELIDNTEKFSDIMKNIYTNNYGESFEDIADALAEVQKQMTYLDDADLQNITESAFTLRDTFGYEISESVRTANSMVDQFGISADEAMNLIAQGAQYGLDYSGELLDTINEYSPQFQKLGLSAEDMFQVFASGANNGAFNLDKIGDAVKELSIRVIDGSDTTIAGFEAIGLNADQMAAKFAAGGESAKTAFNETIDALKSMNDPLAQSQAGVNLFGTMWEDLGPTAVLSLNEINDGIDMTYDSMSELKTVRYDDLKNSLSELGRTAEMDLLLPLGERFLPIIQNAIDKAILLVNAFDSEGVDGLLGAIESIAPKTKPVLDFVDTLREKLSGLGIDPTMFAGAVAAAGPMLVIFGKITSLTGSTIGGITSITQGIGQFAANMRLAGSSGTVLSGVLATISSPVGILVIAITAAAAAFAYLMATNDEFRTSILDTFSEISASLMPVIEEIGFAFMSLGKTLFSAIGSVLQAIAPAVAQLVEVVGQLLVAIMPIVSQLVTLLVPVLEQIILLAAQIVIALMPIVTTLISQLVPVIQQILALAMQVISAVMPLIISLINQLMPFISEIVSLVGNLLAAVVPLITQLISQLVPVISEIISAVSEIISTLLPPLISIIEAVMSVVEALMPPIMEIIDVVVEVISTVIDTISPIIAFITEIIQKIIGIITPIVQFISEIVAQIVSFVAPLIETFAGIFGSIFDVVSEIMGNVGEFIGGIFEGVENAWNGLTGFVSGVIDGIASAFDTVVGTIKSIFNVVIGAINGAIWTINLIPGVHIDEMPYLLHGTDDWQGGFARMNEGGRGELTYLPDGTQVIPHDISVKYAKEAARANVQQAESAVFMIDYDRLAAAMTKVRLTPVVALDGERVSRSLSPYTDAEMGDRARQAARGMI